MDEIGPNFTVGESLIGGSGTGALPGTFATGTSAPTPGMGGIARADPEQKVVQAS